MNFALKPICRAWVPCLGGLLAVATSIPAFGADEPVRIEPRVEVTGTAIRRIDTETPSPVQVVTRKDIERSGATTIQELLRSLPIVDYSDFNETVGGQYPGQSGVSSIALRGQYNDATLVLLNGHRLPRNAMAKSSGAGNAVDINMLPLSAIDRVEILKDGASAVYGADAVGGVVNFITRKDYMGAEGHGGYGVSARSDGGETSAGFSAGFGDYDADRYNLIFALDHFKREPIYATQRDISHTADFSRFGGTDARSYFSPSGNILDNVNYLPTGQTVRPCPAADTTAEACRYNYNANPATVYNGANRTQLLLSGAYKVSDAVRLSSELLYAHSSNHFMMQPVGDYYQLADGTWYTGRFVQGGPRQQESEASLLNLVLGFDGRAGAYDWGVSYGYGESRAVTRERNSFLTSTLELAVENGSIDPTVSTNDPAVVDALKVAPERHGLYAMQTLDAKVSGPVFQLPGGAARFALGVSAMTEKRVYTPDAALIAGDVAGAPAQYAADARRTLSSLFGELNLPLRKDLEVQAALHFDHYSTATKLSPKFAVAYKPTRGLLLRGSYAQSFRLPGLEELYGGNDQGVSTIGSSDPTQISAIEQQWCAQQHLADCNLDVTAIYGANPNLKPERARSLSFGLVAEPNKYVSVGLDGWLIRVTDKIGQKTLDAALADGDWYFKDGGYVVNQLSFNVASQSTTGIDLDAQFKLPLGGGNLVLREYLTRYVSQRNQAHPGDEWRSVIGIYGSPRWRNYVSLNLEQPDWELGLAMRSTGGFSDSDQPLPHPEGTREVGVYEEVDLTASYSGIKSLRLTGGIKNLLDHMPPFSEQNAKDGTYSQMGFAEIYSARGRFYYLNFGYTFR